MLETKNLSFARKVFASIILNFVCCFHGLRISLSVVLGMVTPHHQLQMHKQQACCAELLHEM